MEIKYSGAITAGIVGGIFVSMIAVVNAIVGLLTGNTTDPLLPLMSMAISFVALVLAIAVFLGTGALSAYYNRELIKKPDYAIPFGGIAGCAASLIVVGVSIAIALVVPFFNMGRYDVQPGSPIAVAGMVSLMLGFWQCCCGIFVVVIGTTFSIIGSIIYAIARLK